MSVLVCLTHTHLTGTFTKKTCLQIRAALIIYSDIGACRTASSLTLCLVMGVQSPGGLRGGGVKRYREQCSRGFVVGYPLEVGLKNPHTE